MHPIKSVSIAGFTLGLGMFLAMAPARASTCETYPGSQQYTDVGCDNPSNAAGQPAAPQPAAPANALRDQLRRSILAANQAQTAALKARMEDDANRAAAALRAAAQTPDPQAKAQFKRDYDAAMADLNRSGNDLIAKTPNPALRESEYQQLKAVDANATAMANAAGIGATVPSSPVVQATQQDPAPAPLRDVFTVCDQPDGGATRCFEIPRTGHACRAVLFDNSGGNDVVWRDQYDSVCSADDLAQRDAYYSGRPATSDPTPVTGKEVYDATHGACRTAIDTYMNSARDSQLRDDQGDAAGAKVASDAALTAFRAIAADAPCRQTYEAMAFAAGVDVPHRLLSEDDRGAWATAMAPPLLAREVNVPVIATDQNDTQTAPDTGTNHFDMGDVLDAGAQLLDALAGVAGAAAEIVNGFANGYSGGSGYSPSPTFHYNSAPSGSGYVYRPPARSSGSTITGGSN